MTSIGEPTLCGLSFDGRPDADGKVAHGWRWYIGADDGPRYTGRSQAMDALRAEIGVRLGDGRLRSWGMGADRIAAGSGTGGGDPKKYGKRGRR